MHCNLHPCVISITYVSFLPQMTALIPTCRRTPVSTIRWRYLISCPVSRLAGPSRTDRMFWKTTRPTRVAQSRGNRSAMATCPEDRKTRRLHSHSGTWSCVFRGRGTPGGQAYYTLLKSALETLYNCFHGLSNTPYDLYIDPNV